MAEHTINIGAIDVTPDYPLQFQNSVFDQLSFVTTPIELLSNDGADKIISHATGFFWRKGEKSYLITNWHVITGRNPFTDDVMSETAYLPSRIRVYGTTSNQIDFGENFHSFDRSPLIIDLNDPQTSCMQYKNFGKLKVDIAVIKISNDVVSGGRVGGYLNNYGFEQLFNMVGADCFVVGYPLKNYAGKMIPIWKRGTLATEPILPVDNKPMFIVDAATMAGMSGSPVFRRVYGPAFMADRTLRLDVAVTTEFVGIYSGRLQSKEMSATNLGYAWYGNLIDDVISHGVPLSR